MKLHRYKSVTFIGDIYVDDKQFLIHIIPLPNGNLRTVAILKSAAHEQFEQWFYEESNTTCQLQPFTDEKTAYLTTLTKAREILSQKDD